MRTFLITGGAGYIGSHVALELVRLGDQVVLLDDLAKGHPEAARVIGAKQLVVGRTHERDKLHSLFARYDFIGVLHFSAFSLVGESVNEPEKYYENNVAGTMPLLDAIVEDARRRTLETPIPIVFSSTAAVYGEPEVVPIPEDHPKRPTNPYGETKWAVERMLHWYGAAHGLRSVALRYFNAAGADPKGVLGEDHHPETHLIPLVLQAATGRRSTIEIFGTDYPTDDGTCIRDYVHVTDLASAHILAMQKLLSNELNEPTCTPFNLGNGHGFSVREVIRAAERVVGRAIPTRESAPRPGDPAVLVASAEQATEVLGWSPRYRDIEEIVATAWEWHRAHPEGYGDSEHDK